MNNMPGKQRKNFDKSIYWFKEFIYIMNGVCFH